jgi:hypothetical protein
MLTKNDIVIIEGIFDKKLKPIKRDLKKIKKIVEDTSNFLDREILADRKRIATLEEQMKSQKSYV